MSSGGSGCRAGPAGPAARPRLPARVRGHRGRRSRGCRGAQPSRDLGHGRPPAYRAKIEDEPEALAEHLADLGIWDVDAMTHVAPRHSCVSGPFGPPSDHRGAAADGRRAPAGPRRRGDCLAGDQGRELHRGLHGRRRWGTAADSGDLVSGWSPARHRCRSGGHSGGASQSRALRRAGHAAHGELRAAAHRRDRRPDFCHSTPRSSTLASPATSWRHAPAASASSADAPPDMRFDETAACLPSLDLIDRSSRARARRHPRDVSVKNAIAGRIAKAILAARAEGRLLSAADLAGVVAAASPRPRRGDPGGIHPATRTFQALRIAVNRELEVLGAGPRRSARRSATRRPAWPSSATTPLEDRIVKRFIARESRDCVRGSAPAGLHLRPPGAAPARSARVSLGQGRPPTRWAATAVRQRKAARRREARRRERIEEGTDEQGSISPPGQPTADVQRPAARAPRAPRQRGRG